MKRVTWIAQLILIACVIAGARNAADLKRDLAGILPAGMKVRLAWIHGGNFTEFPFYAATTAVYVVDSDDGIIRRLYPATGSGTFYQVDITADGSRVLFYNKDTGRLCVINWNGSGFKEINVGGEPIEYWRHPTAKSDWSVVYVNNMSRVNIDTPSVRVTIGAPGIASNGGGGLSDDGTKLVGYCYEGCTGGPFGIINTASLQWLMGPHGGCWCSMGAGATPKYNHNPSGHQQMCVHDASDQTKFTVYPVTDSLSAFLKRKGLQNEWADGFYSNEGTRFTQHPEFATTQMQWSKANPFLLHLPDLKCVYIEDSLPKTFCGDMDGVFLAAVGSSNGRPVSIRAAGLHRGVKCHEAYLPDGRRLGPLFLDAKSTHRAAARGVVIRRFHGAETAAGNRLAVDLD